MAPVRSTTTLRRWDPLQEFDALQVQLGQLFGPAWGTTRPAAGRPASGWRPAADVARTEQAYVVRIEVPGVRREDLGIEVDEKVLHVSGELAAPAEGEQRSGTRRYGRFDYRAQLPADADLDTISAELADGVLTVTVPKAEEARPRRIEISAN
jgi:HSP20 family protein